MGRVLESGLLAQLIACVTNYRDAGRLRGPHSGPYAVLKIRAGREDNHG